MEELIVPVSGTGLFPPETRPASIALDRLYGEIWLTELAQRLSQTHEMARLRRVSHLGLLDGMVDFGASASKYEHSRGVYWLMVILTRSPELAPYRDLLTAVAFAHDMGSPPFTHSAEPVMHQVLEIDHEGITSQAPYQDGEFARVVEAAGLDYAEVCALVQGRHHNPLLQDAISGPLDMDTLDGTGRYALAARFVERGPAYRPYVLVHYYGAESGRWVIREMDDDLGIAERELGAFAECRAEVFNWIHRGPVAGPESLIGRALYLAAEAGHIEGEFFRLTDEQAYWHLTRCGTQVQMLVERALRGRHYVCQYDRTWIEDKAGPLLRSVLEPGLNRQLLADRLAEALGLPRSAVTVHMGRSKGSKNLIGLPTLREEGQPMRLLQRPPHWFASVYIDPDYPVRTQEVERQFEAFLG